MERLREHWAEIAVVLVAVSIPATGRLYPLLPVLLACLATAAVLRPLPWSGAALAVALAGSVPLADTSDRAVLLGLVCLAVWSLALAVRARRAATERETRARVESETYRAVAEERLQIARDLHDLVAHGLSAMTVQAGYGALTGEGDPHRAVAALSAIEDTGRETLAQVRQLLDVLRDQETPLRPTPRIADLPELFEATGRGGVRVTADVRLSDDSLPADVGGCVYNVVREGLSNVLRHSEAGEARVTVTDAGDEVAVTVADDGGTPGPRTGTGRAAGPDLSPGHGLLGIRERVALLHGRVAASGRTPDGGYLLEVRLPLARVRDIA
jgi:signal transduction histidine kinase